MNQEKDFVEARRGLIAPFDPPRVEAADGRVDEPGPTFSIVTP